MKNFDNYNLPWVSCSRHLNLEISVIKIFLDMIPKGDFRYLCRKFRKVWRELSFWQSLGDLLGFLLAQFHDSEASLEAKQEEEPQV